jgi:alpha-galactosidase
MGRTLTAGARWSACLLALLALAAPAARAAASVPPWMVRLAPTPPMGWDPWYQFGCGADQQLVEQTAQAIVSSGMAAAGYRYVNLDDCWMAPARDASGDLQADPTSFPDGIPQLATYVHGLGLKLGIYLDVGTETCLGRPGSEGYVAQDAATIASWGVDFLKLDYCFTNFAPPQPLYAAMHNALLAEGRPIVLSVSDDAYQYPWRWGPGIASLWRTTNDYTAYGAATGDWWEAVLKIATLNSSLYRFAGPGAWNDPDNLLIGTGLLTVPQERSQFSLWSVMAAPLIADGDVRSMSKADASILTDREVIAVDQDPAGRQGVRIVDRGSQQVWLRRLADGSHVLLFLNTGAQPAQIGVSVSRAGLANRRYRVRDLWRHISWVTSAATMRIGVQPDDVVMLRLTAVGKA